MSIYGARLSDKETEEDKSSDLNFNFDEK